MKAILLIDCQYDFLEGGALPVNGSVFAMDKLTSYLKDNGDEFEYKLFTLDAHPYNHCSFKDANKEGMWPRHCVEHSRGGAIYSPLQNAAEESNGMVYYLTKGTMDDREEYSIMDNKKSEKILRMLLDEESPKIDSLFVVGIAGDICVLNSIKGLVKAGYKDKIVVLPEFCPSIDGGKSLINYLDDEGITYF